ncbi:putative PurR-regulated permease PerM [Actinomycetospora succinea]|uniref:Putative PurR-regulated permease PerM n=1 Tax=Actinomycetospora succinea TaxID=663603 RepID=A0A4V3D7B8_9PSEU|nr:AI-2E family transporter [Actinomycetospora succinea]TDQ47337.1 putative PurR-regulated permease PerM [Actinomycetospora succinea]
MTASSSLPEPEGDPGPADGPGPPKDIGDLTGSKTVDRGPEAIIRPARRWEVPVALEIASGLAWRVLLLATAGAIVVYVMGLLSAVLIPVVLAVIAASLLAPEAHALSRRWRHVPHALATALVLFAGIAIVTAVFYGVVLAFISGLPDLTTQLTASLTGIQEWLRTGPLGLNNEQFNAIGTQVIAYLQSSQSTLATSALGAVGTVGELFTEMLLTLFTLIFFVYDGGLVWRFLLGAVPKAARNRTDIAGRRAFASLVGYTRATVLVAAADAVTAGLGLWLIGVPLAVPLAALIFFGAFVPTLGAVVTGVVAVLVALVSGGLTDALLVVLLLIAVQNIEGYILQPLLLGRSIKLHPLAVVLPIACGLVIAGIPGALLAVPIVTVLDSGIRSLVRPSDGAGLDPATVNPLDPRSARPEWHDVEPSATGLRGLFRRRRPG